jgi:4-hydroxythreonine-4-phosphate dehydrogenase
LITAGDPEGIGPEVAVKAARQLGLSAILVGEVAALRRWDEGLPLVKQISAVSELSIFEPPEGEAVEVAAIRLAADACLDGRASAMVTGPIHKARLAAKGFAYSGHTDFLGALCGTDPMMAFVGKGLRVGLLSTHIPLSEVPQAATPERLERCVRLCEQGLIDLGLSRRRIAVAGINPHAGEGGLLGQEEEKVLKPVCRRLVEEGLDLVGPMAAEIAFTQLRRGEVDMVLAMYHDQGLAPLKIVAFGELVNWSLGLPIVRTSVDHGTADDIAGQGTADPGSMVAAIQLALQLSGST